MNDSIHACLLIPSSCRLQKHVSFSITSLRDVVATVMNASHDTSRKYLPHAFACLRDKVSIALFLLQIMDCSLDREICSVDSIGVGLHPGSSFGKHRPQVR